MCAHADEGESGQHYRDFSRGDDQDLAGFEDMAKDAEQQGAAKDAEQQGAAKDAEQRGARDESAVEDLDETAEIAQVFLTHPLHIAMDTC